MYDFSLSVPRGLAYNSFSHWYFTVLDALGNCQLHDNECYVIMSCTKVSCCFKKLARLVVTI